MRNFLHRHDLCLRRVTTLGRVLPKDCVKQAKGFIKHANNLALKYPPNTLFALDETSIQVDDPGTRTYDSKGSKQIKAVTAGGEKTKISALFCASADGTKLPVLVLLPRKTPLKDFVVPDNVIVEYKKYLLSLFS